MREMEPVMFHSGGSPAPAFVPSSPAPAFVPDPPHGRVFAVSRDVRSSEVTPGGRLRFDALARYLQDAAEDDLADAGWREPCDWLVRRVSVVVGGYPAHGDPLALRTFCSATGPRWAERTTTVTRSGTDLMQAVAIWVAVARADGRPAPLGPAFHRLYGEATQGRTVSARLSHPGPAEPQAGRAWPLRASDFDTAGHVNNAIAWAAAEDVLAGHDWLPARAELEYRRPILPGHDVRLVAGHTPDQVSCWLLNGTQPLASAQLRRGIPGPE
jgi:acyl-ACP thioesterase